MCGVTSSWHPHAVSTGLGWRLALPEAWWLSGSAELGGCLHCWAWALAGRGPCWAPSAHQKGGGGFEEQSHWPRPPAHLWPGWKSVLLCCMMSQLFATCTIVAIINGSLCRFRWPSGAPHGFPQLRVPSPLPPVGYSRPKCRQAHATWLACFCVSFCTELHELDSLGHTGSQSLRS